MLSPAREENPPVLRQFGSFSPSSLAARFYIFCRNHGNGALRPFSGTGGNQLGRNVTILDRPVRTVLFELLNAQPVRNSQRR
ncbi:hypothetical protein NKJ35_29635 [Mesorhizobium sp. M0136]|uniref:hypothetical protein n=1 Tax=Mesorhizobium sp. M0136 TaxID=2956890 RepID=UPI00333BB786